MDNINGIELDRKHRFLDYGTPKKIVDSWSAYFNKKNVPHKTLKTMYGWTIYKHMITASEGHKRSYCCEQGANYFRTTEQRQETKEI